MSYAAIILGTVATAVIGSLFTAQSLTNWYLTLNLPSWTPPGSVIGTVWTVLYTLIAIAGVLAWRNLTPYNRTGFAWLLGVNLVLNALWSYLFFSAHQIGTALFEMLFLLGTSIALVTLLWPKVRIAAWLLVPYALWVAFATYLTYTIWRLN